MKKRLKKKGYRKSATAKRLSISDREVAGYRAEVAKANRRIAQLERAGYEPKMLTFIYSAIDARQFPNISQLTTKHDFTNMYNLVRAFNKNKGTTVRGAIKEEQERYRHFVESLEQIVGEKLPADVERALYPYMAGIDWRELRKSYEYEEIKLMMYELLTVGIAPTNDYVKMGLDDGIRVAIEHYLSEYIPSNVLIAATNFDVRDFDFYVQFAINNGIGAAINEYQSDRLVGELSDYDFLE